jgi:hypothetical protein
VTRGVQTQLTEERHVHIERGPIEKMQEEPVAFRVLRDGMTVVPVWALGCRVYETWRGADGEKYGRWTWELV